jgi:broad specificity phosphatase PhoE
LSSGKRKSASARTATGGISRLAKNLMDIRLLLVSHATTVALRAARFPDDDPLDSRGLADTRAARAGLRLPSEAIAFTSPAACARDTALALGLAATIADPLADVNYGHWRGQKLAAIAAQTPHELAAWTRDPDAAAPGGESFVQVVQRVGNWLDAVSDEPIDSSSDTRNMIAVTHTPVIRAAIVHALGAAPAVFSRIEIAPLSGVELRRSARGWTWWPARQP